jgi:hypothetical protein
LNLRLADALVKLVVLRRQKQKGANGFPLAPAGSNCGYGFSGCSFFSAIS